MLALAARPVDPAERLLAAYIEADAKLRAHRAHRPRHTDNALIVSTLMLRTAIAESNLAAEIDANGGTMTIDGRRVTVCMDRGSSDRRRRRWIGFL